MNVALAPWQQAWLESRDDPYKFAVGVLGIPEPGQPTANGLHALEPWQAKVFMAIRDGKFRVSIRSGHGCKKSATLAILVLWGLLTHKGAKIPVVAGSESQLVDTIWPEIGIWHKRLPVPLQNEVDVQKTRVVVRCAPDEAFAVARTASRDNPQAMAGFHAPFLMFLVDEASGVAEPAYEVALGALSTEGAIAVLAGNPSKPSGFFYDTHHKMRDRWCCIHVSSEDVPTARGHIGDIIARYGKDSNAYRVRVLGEFPTHSDAAVIPLEMTKTSRGRKVAKIPVKPIWGVDVARFGDDRSVVVKREGNFLIGAPLIWQNLDSDQVSGRIIDEFERTPNDMKPAAICVDSIGLGLAVVALLRAPGSPVNNIVVEVNVAESASITPKFARKRDELWWKGREWFEAKDCCLPKLGEPDGPRNEEEAEAVEILIGELTTVTYDFAANGKIVVQSKDEMKKEGMRSPDVADAFLNTFGCGTFIRDHVRDIHRGRHRPSDDRSPWSI